MCSMGIVVSHMLMVDPGRRAIKGAHAGVCDVRVWNARPQAPLGPTLLRQQCWVRPSLASPRLPGQAGLCMLGRLRPPCQEQVPVVHSPLQQFAKPVMHALPLGMQHRPVWQAAPAQPAGCKPRHARCRRAR